MVREEYLIEMCFDRFIDESNGKQTEDAELGHEESYGVDNGPGRPA